MKRQDIRKIVKEGYEAGDYAGHFRTDDQPNEFEKAFLEFISEYTEWYDSRAGIFSSVPDMARFLASFNV